MKGSSKSADVSVCMLVHGNAGYFRSARRAALSVLKRTDFDLFLAASRPLSLRTNARVRMETIPEIAATSHRSERFLRKFEALQACLASSRSEWILLLDCDALIVTPLSSRDVRAALGKAGLGMVEQTGIRGSAMSRSSFLEHYRNYTLRYLDPARSCPSLEDFRFYNSGVVLGHRSEWAGLADWAIRKIQSAQDPHQVGIHMIADQDYLQYWTNTLHPGSCATLPWEWNHCEHWDDPFPRPGAKIVHFSNFCNGPTRKQLLRMAWLDWKLNRGESHARD